MTGDVIHVPLESIASITTEVALGRAITAGNILIHQIELLKDLSTLI